MAVNEESRTGVASGREQSSALRLLSELAPTLVPTMYEVGERTWPKLREVQRHKFGVVGPMVTVREELPRRFAVLLRRRHLATLKYCWRLEIGGPVEFFEWDSSGRVVGDYGVRYPVISIAPVMDENGNAAGYAINGRPTPNPDGELSSIDARLDCAAYVRSGDPAAVVEAVKLVSGRPRIEEFRPGLDPSARYFQVLQLENKQDYFRRRGANEYVGPDWTPGTIEDAFEPEAVRAVVLAHPGEPSETLRPQSH